MAHTSEKRWNGVVRTVSDQTSQTLEMLSRNRELFLQLFEAWDFADGTATGFAALLFKEEVNQRDPAVPTAEEIAMAQDLADAVAALNGLWEYANNIPDPVADDRARKMRRVV